MMKWLIIITVIAFSACSIKEQAIDVDSIQHYVNDATNGLIRTRTTNGIRMTVQVQPAILELLSNTQTKEDSCSSGLAERLKQYEDQLTFHLNIAPDAEHRKGDVMYAGTHDLKSVLDQAHELNYMWNDHVELICGSRTYKPLLSTFENTYGLTNDRNVILVFTPDEIGDPDFYGSKTLDLLVQGGPLKTGLQHFKFDREALQAVPKPIL